METRADHVDAAAVRHPLEPLSASEMEAAVAILKGQEPVATEASYAVVSLHEPPKSAVQAGDSCARQAFLMLVDKLDGTTYEAVVSLDDDTVVRFDAVPGVRAPFMLEEYDEFVAAVMQHPEYQAALERRGIDDMELVSIDPVPAGYWHVEPHEDDGRRL